MGWLSGLLSGYADRHQQIREDAARADLDAQKREADIYNRLLNSNDPKLQGYGATGILQLGQPRTRKSGFAGWMGEMENSPVYATIQKYMQTPQLKVDEDTPGYTVTPQQAGYLPTPPPAAKPAALPTTQTTAPGQPGPAPVQTTPPPAPPGQAALSAPETLETDENGTVRYTTGVREPAPVPLVMGTGPGVQGPPPTPFSVLGANLGPGVDPESLHVPAQPRSHYELPRFPTVEDAESKAALAKQKADIQADAWMYQQAHPEWSPQQAYQAAAKLAEEHAGGRGGISTTYIKGGVLPDKTSPTGFSQQWVLRSDPTRQQVTPAQPPNTPEYEFYKERARRIGTIAQTPEEAWAQARKDNPRGTEAEIATEAQAKWEFSRQMMEQEKQGIPGMGQLPTSAGPTGAPPTPPTGPATSTPTTPPQPNAPGQPAAASGPPNFQGAIAPGFRDVSPRTGQPLNASAQEAVNGARATNDLVDRALATLEPFKDRNNEADGLEMAMNYKKGIEDSLGVAAQLSNLAALQSAATKALSQGGSRAYQFVIDKQQHVPRLPADEQIAKYEMATKYLHMDREDAARMISLYYRNKGEPVWDTPKTMIEKLLVVKQNLKDYIRDAMNVDIPEPGPGAATPATNQNRPAAPPPPPPGAGTGGRAGATATPPGRIDANSDIVYGPNGATVVPH